MNNVKSLKEIVISLLECGYECEAGPLKNNMDFQQLAVFSGVGVVNTVCPSQTITCPAQSPKEGNTLEDAVTSAKNAMVAAGVALREALENSRSPQEIRDDIIEQAKRDVAGILGEYGSFNMTVNGYENQAVKAKFVVNAEKRTIVALIYGHFSGKLYHRGIAKCAPDDCFNVHIGKAIALRRALGLEVPAEYLNPPQPTEVRDGDVIRASHHKNGSFYVKNRSNMAIINRDLQNGVIKVIDDSREEVAE